MESSYRVLGCYVEQSDWLSRGVLSMRLLVHDWDPESQSSLRAESLAGVKLVEAVFAEEESGLLSGEGLVEVFEGLLVGVGSVEDEAAGVAGREFRRGRELDMEEVRVTEAGEFHGAGIRERASFFCFSSRAKAAGPSSLARFSSRG